MELNVSEFFLGADVSTDAFAFWSASAATSSFVSSATSFTRARSALEASEAAFSAPSSTLPFVVAKACSFERASTANARNGRFIACRAY